MSEKKRISLKLNLFDICILAVALAAAAGLLLWAFLGGRFSEDKKPISVHYVIELEQMHEGPANLVKVNDELYDRTKNQLLGTVNSVDLRQTTVLSKNTIDGEFLFAKVPNRKNVRIDITTDGFEYEDRIVLESGKEVRAGTFIYVVGPGYCGSGYILSVERGEG